MVPKAEAVWATALLMIGILGVPVARSLGPEAPGIGRDERAPLDPEALRTPLFVPALRRSAVLAPAGLLVAYVVRKGALSSESAHPWHYTPTGMLPDYATGTSLRASNTRLGGMTPLSEGFGAVSDPAWAPDAAYLAFYSDRGGVARVWVWSRRSMQARPIADAIARPSFFSGANLKWTPDGKSIIALVLPGDLSIDQANARRDASGGPARNNLATASIAAAALSADLALIDVTSGEVKRLARDKVISWYAASPDGRWIAYAYPSGAALEGAGAAYQLEAVFVDNGSVRVVSEGAYADDGVCAWSPDSTQLAYVSVGARTKVGVHVVDIISRTDREVTPDTHFTVGPRDEHRRVYWTPDGASLLFVFNGILRSVAARGSTVVAVTPPQWDREAVQVVSNTQGNLAWTRNDGSVVTVTTRNPANEDMGFYRVELTKGKTTRMREEAKRYGDYLNPAIVSEDGTFVMWMSEDSQMPRALWGAGPNLKDALLLTKLDR